MFNLKTLLLIIGILSLVFGVKFIYDARPIVKKYFIFGDKNDATLGLKIFGFIFEIIGGLSLVLAFLLMVIGAIIMYFVY